MKDEGRAAQHECVWLGVQRTISQGSAKKKKTANDENNSDKTNSGGMLQSRTPLIR
jgi:hypothetical protein